ncbi:MAG: Gallidermin [Actinomycetota bacterium]|nr:Gallidermin [Actinomycetota bacterium]
MSASAVANEFDIDLATESVSQDLPAKMITSVIFCTEGCTSPNTGSGCSFCC